MKTKIISSEYISQHQYFTARRDAYELASGKIVDPYFVVELPPSATAMAITEDNQVILISQYRHPISKEILELPGGFIEPGENIFDGIKRELLEETGYTFKDVYHLGNTAANPGVLNNFTELFLATGGIKTNNQNLDSNEEISIQLKSLEEVKEMLQQSKFIQSMQALCLFYGFEKLEDLRGF
jgi:8-oxo-dGTP pyrophosphatase MutT (NUDIX family)